MSFVLKTTCDTVCIPTIDIIVVDPQPQDYDMLTAHEQTWNYRIRSFANGSDAIRSSIAMFDGLWLINMRLPDMSGIDLLRLIRERDRTATVYLVSDSHCFEEEISARSAGPTAYVCKPPQPSWLSSLRPEVRAGPTAQTTNKNSFTQPAAYY